MSIFFSFGRNALTLSVEPSRQTEKYREVPTELLGRVNAPLGASGSPPERVSTFANPLAKVL